MADLVCQYCRKLMTAEREPVLMQCGHTFCRACVELWPVFGGSDAGMVKNEGDRPPVNAIAGSVEMHPSAMESNDALQGAVERSSSM